MADKKISKINLSGESYEIDVATNLKATNILSADKSKTSKVATVGAVQKPDGVHALFDENNKISSSYLSDTILGQLKFGGSLYLGSEDPTEVPNLCLSIYSSAALNDAFQEYLKNLENFDHSWIVHQPGLKFKIQINPYDYMTPEWNFCCPYGMEGRTPEIEVKFPVSICEGYYFIAGTDFSGAYYSAKHEAFSSSYSEDYSTVVLAETQVGDWHVVTNGQLIKIDNTDTITHIKDSYTSLLSIEGAGLKLNKITKNTKGQVVIDGEALVGTPSGKDESAIVNVGYLKANTVPELSDTNVKLSEDIWTDKSIGYINASASSPKKVASKDDTLKTMFTNIFGTVTDDTSNLVTLPDISGVTIKGIDTAGNQDTSFEYGTKINSVSVTVSKSAGSYKYGPAVEGAGWTGNYTFSGTGFKAQTNSSSNDTQTLELSSTFTVGTSSALTLDVSRGYTAATNTADSKMGADTTQKISAGTADGSGTFNPKSKKSVYYAVTSDTSTPASWTSTESTSIADIAISADAGKYVWIAATDNKASIYAFNEVSGKYNTDKTPTTKSSTTTTITNSQGAQPTGYYLYMTTNPKAKSGTVKYKLA